ncbi:helix-turn-helix domain-containing protein [Frankia sp. QA3]|uniref:helix-turn-helix domain-containing protein n=1 Tax=Frankia sp. QA3 TaxID=710111 RepID=UPI000568C8C6|nr:helix-turn-helix domain-containing protein [Frankia sp. QA3]
MPLAPSTGVSVRATRAVLVALVAYIDAGSWSGAFPSLPTLAGRAECSVRTARRALRALEAAGVLVTELGGGRRSNRYRLVRPVAVEDEAPDAAPSAAGQPGQDDRRPRRSTSLLRSAQKRRAAAPRSKTEKRTRITEIPDDLRPLADALVSRGLRAAFGLTVEQVANVRQAVAQHGVTALVTAAYRAWRRDDPARWWSAWLGLWTGLPSVPVKAPESHAEPRSSISGVPVPGKSSTWDEAAACLRARLATLPKIAY